MSVVAAGERLAALTAAGTSVWLDQLRRGMVETGELEQMVQEDCLRGVTSNPAIFEKAILGSPDYDDDIPGESYSFRELMDAQADGDLETLRAHGLTSIRVRVPAGDAAKGIDALERAVG